MKRLVFLVFSLATIAIQAAPEPKIGAVLRHEGAHEISVIYSERVDIGTLGNPDNYSISPGSITSLRLVATNQGALLRVTGLTASGTLSIVNVTDPSGGTLPPATLEFNVPDRLWAEIGANEFGYRPDVIGIPENGFDLFSGGIQQRDEYDDATFMGETIEGDFDVKVRVEYVEPAGAGAKAGIMIREKLDEGKTRPLDPDDPAQAFSRYVELAVSAPVSVLNEPSADHEIWQRAVSPSLETLSLAVTNDAPPAFPDAWLRIERIGNQFTMYRGADGANWQKIGGATFNPPLLENVYVGLAFSPQNDDISPSAGLRKSFVAKFRDYELIPKTSETGEIHIQVVGDHAEVSWDPGWTLQTAPTVLGEWADLPAATSPWRVNFTEPMRFYRLKK